MKNVLTMLCEAILKWGGPENIQAVILMQISYSLRQDMVVVYNFRKVARNIPIASKTAFLPYLDSISL
jgi:hypothetical protein